MRRGRGGVQRAADVDGGPQLCIQPHAPKRQLEFVGTERCGGAHIKLCYLQREGGVELLCEKPRHVNCDSHSHVDTGPQASVAHNQAAARPVCVVADAKHLGGHLVFGDRCCHKATHFFADLSNKANKVSGCLQREVHVDREQAV